VAAPGPGLVWPDPASPEVQVRRRDGGLQLRLAVKELLRLVGPREADPWHERFYAARRSGLVGDSLFGVRPAGAGLRMCGSGERRQKS
jgi:hypothetical protein